MSLNQKMVVGIHQAIGMTDQSVPSDNFPQNLEKTYAVALIEEDRLLQVAKRSHMVDGVFELKPGWPGHM